MKETKLTGTDSMAMGFFQKSSMNQRQNDIHLDVSFRQDGYIRVIAMSLVDQLLSGQFHDLVVARKLLEGLKQYFPDSIPDAAHTNAIETLQLMVTSPRKPSKTVLALTWVLRQQMVDTLCQSPLQYLSAFIDQGDIVSSSELRQPGKPVNPVALSALAKLLNVVIVVRETEPDKQLPALTRYGQGDNRLDINVSAGRYSAQLEHLDAFRPLSVNIRLQENDPCQNLTHEVSGKKIQTLLNSVIQSTNETVRWLHNMLQDKSLVSADLFSLYAAHATDMTWQKQFVHPSTDLLTLLVNVTATMISFGLVSRDDLFDEPNQSVSSPTMV